MIEKIKKNTTIHDFLTDEEKQCLANVGVENLLQWNCSVGRWQKYDKKYNNTLNTFGNSVLRIQPNYQSERINNEIKEVIKLVNIIASSPKEDSWWLIIKIKELLMQINNSIMQLKI